MNTPTMLHALFILGLIAALAGSITLLQDRQRRRDSCLLYTSATLMLAIFGMTVVYSLTAGNMLKGAIVVLLILLLACIGQDPINGYSRFTFGNHNLIGGLSLVPVLIGVFSLPEVFNLVEELARSRGHEHQPERLQVGSMRV